MTDFRIAMPLTGNQSLADTNVNRAIDGLQNRQARNSSAKIDKAARDFESILVGQWLEKAEKSFATVPGTDPDQDSDSSRDQFQSIACQFLAGDLSKTGAFGIAPLIRKQLEAAEVARESREAAGASALPGAAKLENTK
jgi:Rod binding domain-containing protein